LRHGLKLLVRSTSFPISVELAKLADSAGPWVLVEYAGTSDYIGDSEWQLVLGGLESPRRAGSQVCGLGAILGLDDPFQVA
jgi:hypothetical protein